MTEVDKDLAALAGAYGVATEYQDQVGKRVLVSAESVRGVLTALGVDASDPAQCRKSAASLAQQKWEAVLPPVMVVRHTSDGDANPWEMSVRVPQNASVRLWVELEDGARRFDVTATKRSGESAVIKGHRIDEVTYIIPHDLPLGWHELVAECDGVETQCTLVVTPEKLDLTALEEQRSWGVATQLYSVRSRHSWGLGDLADLNDLASWFGREHGADFILVNPLHASAPVEPMEASPYLPVTRRYVNPLYIRVEAIPEFGYLPLAEREYLDPFISEVQRANTSSDLLDRDKVWQAKRKALDLVRRVEMTPGRLAEYSDYVDDEGEGLLLFATWCALAEEYGAQWNDWPQELQDHESEAVAAEALRLSDRIEFHRWLQFIVDEQMGQAQHIALDAGMRIGIMHDLAVGVHPSGADTWSEGSVMARGVAVGAPPDQFNQVGQNWSQPPRRPDQLAATGYASYRDMLRTLLRHSGGLRIDHVLGLFRLWWIPDGNPPSIGTYVRYDHHAMVNILVLEAQRAGALIVGEDLGTVEPWVRDFMAERGILGTTILFFERDRETNDPKPPQEWRKNAMATVTVHDLPPTIGFLTGEHVKLRAELGLLTRSLEDEQAAHEKSMVGWREILHREGLLRENASVDQVVVALHRLMTRSPSRLLTVSLPDLVGDHRIQNQPGTHEEYPNWCVPLSDPDGRAVILEDIPTSEKLAPIMSAIGATPNRRRGR